MVFRKDDQSGGAREGRGMLTECRDRNRSICTRQKIPTFSVLIRRSGIRGFLAKKPSVKIKAIPNTTHENANEMTIGSSQGNFCPPMFMTRRKVVVVVAKVTAPKKSKSRNLGESLGASAVSAFGFAVVRRLDGSCHPAMKKQMSAIGAWPKNDLLHHMLSSSSPGEMSICKQESYHLQPIVSARNPPTGPPKLLPAIPATLT